MSTSEVNVAITLDHTATDGHDLVTAELVQELEALDQAKVEVTHDLSLVALIGNHLNITAGLGAEVFQQLVDFNIRLLGQGASEHNVCFLVNSDAGERVAQRLHQLGASH